MYTIIQVYVLFIIYYVLLCVYYIKIIYNAIMMYLLE